MDDELSENNQQRALSPKKEMDVENLNSTDSSLSLSITPPILDEEGSKNNQNDHSESISEHISTESNSVENDRSFQEIEITNQAFLNVLPHDDRHISQESKPSLNSSDHSFSLNLKDKSASDNVRSILDEILHNSQFKSDSETINNSKDESLDIFANLDLDDKSITLGYRGPTDSSLNEKNLNASNFSLPLKSDTNYGEVVKRIKDFEEIVAIKDTTIAALTSELDSYREMSNTNTMSMVSTTEYKQLQEECQNKLTEYNEAIIIKNDLIQKLTESLDQSVLERKLLIVQIESFKDEIAQLQTQLQDTTQMVKDHKCDTSIAEDKTDTEYTSQKELAQPLSPSVLKVDVDCSDIVNYLDPTEVNEFNKIKDKVNSFINNKIESNTVVYVNEIEALKLKVNSEQEEYESELKRLRDLLANIKCGSTEIMELKNELEAKYSKEIEELRTYFEKKCSDLEKNYSEEIFSQHSRKMSGSSCSENSDLLFSSGPGPGGDMLPEVKPISKKDIIKLKSELDNLLTTISNYDINNLTDETLKALRNDFNKCQINHIIKYDLSNIKNDLQNKYHAELEILNEENENKMDEMHVQYDKKLMELKEKYEDDLMKFKSQMQVYNGSSTQEVASSGDFEINEVVESYERRLQEQVTLAKIDIISALENQIQRLVANEADDEEWPSELLQLRDRFTDKYERDIMRLKEEHATELEKLKEEHIKVLNGALERARRRSLRDNESLNKGELELLKERDSLKRQTVSLRNLLGELLKYFTQCEDELNNTLVDELLKQGFDKNITQLEEELNLNDSSATTSSKTDSSFIKRVHLTPNFEDLMNMIDNTSSENESIDISTDLKNELGQCLEKLRQDANAILALTTNLPKPSPPPDSPQESMELKLSSITRQLISETQIKNQLKDELDEATSIIQSMEKEKNSLESQLGEMIIKINFLETNLGKAKDKIAELVENGHREIVSVGYGNNGQPELGINHETLTELQEKARTLLSKSRTTADPALLSLIEDLCQISEKIKEDAKKERIDLVQQIKAADKKYKQTREFLDEQAIERELERDEAQKKIEQLHEGLRERDKDRTNCQRYTSEVEHLESQLQDVTKALTEESRRFKEVEGERDEAVEKIKELREIIRELESQVETYSKEIHLHAKTIEELKCIINHQTRSIDELKQNESIQGFSDIHEQKRRIEDLEAELQQLTVNAELAGSEGAQKQLKIQLHDLEVSFEKKIKNLESFYCSTNSCSSPSEDMSVRDVLRPHTPNSMVLDDCEIPLQQLARLKEKLVRHSRAEDAAIKKIRDLEMQVFNLKAEIEESSNEKDILKRQIQEHLVLISDLQIRLDEQRLRAENNEKQINSSLELKIYDLQNEISTLNELIQKKEKNIHHLNGIVEETKKHLKDQEKELQSNRDDELLASMQREIERLRQENNQLKTKINNEAHILPNLVENIISDKNTDIEKLQDKLDETEKRLKDYTSLNLELKELQTLSNLKNSGNSLTEVLSLIDISEPDQMRRHCESRDDFTAPIVFSKNKNETVFMNADTEISSIEKVGFPNIHFSTPGPLTKPNSTELYKSIEKKVHFEDECVDKLNNEILSLKNELQIKNNLIKDCEERLILLANLEEKIEKLQATLDTTEQALVTAQETFEREQKEILDQEQNLRLELAEKKLHLSEKEKQVAFLEKDSTRKDEMLLDMANEKRNLEKEVAHLKHENFVAVDKVIIEKNETIQHLQEKLDNKNKEILNTQKELIQEKEQQIDSLQTKINTLEQSLKHENDMNRKLEKEIQNYQNTIQDYKTEYDNLVKKLSKKKHQIKDLELNVNSLNDENRKYADQVLDKNCEIEIMNEDIKRYQADLYKLEDEIKEHTKENMQVQIHKLQKVLEEKDLIISNVMKKSDELNKEILHLQDLINNKDKIIDKISDDHKKVNSNLVTIQKKLKEPGGLIDARQKLRDEQKRNAELLQELHILKAQAITNEIGRKNTEMVTSVEEIASQVKKELDYSAEIDTNILTAVSGQSMTSLTETHDLETYRQTINKYKIKLNEIMQIKKGLEKKHNDLESKYDALKQEKDILETQLDRLKYNLQQVQFEDAKLIEQMRIKLNNAMDNEEEFGKIIDEEKRIRQTLESELDTLRLKQASNSKTESTEYKNLPNFEEILRNELKLEKEKNVLLRKTVKSNDRLKQEAENNLNYTKQMLNLEKDRINGMEIKIKCFMETESELKENLRRNKVSLEEKLWEIETHKMTITDLQKERENLLKEKNDIILNMPLNTNQFLNEPVHDIVLKKIQEINKLLTDYRAMVDLINQLRNEKNQLERELEELRALNSGNNHNPDLTVRCDFLFAKNLRLHSFRKALLWQKRYLVDVINNHEIKCKVPLLQCPRNVRKGKICFKSVATCIVAIFRMKFMVRRWHSGVRAAGRINSRYNRYETTLSNENPIAQFHVGQPISNLRFSTIHGSQNSGLVSDGSVNERNPGSSRSQNDIPWSGSTPPQKEKRVRIGHNLLNPEDLAPLKAPQLLAQFVDRIDTIQETLGVVLNSRNDSS